MKLQRQSIKLGSEYRGKWQFCILDKNAEELERVENILCAMDTGFSIGGKEKTWHDYCDLCPLYEEGMGCGFMIDIDDVPAFKAAFKLAKAKK